MSFRVGKLSAVYGGGGVMLNTSKAPLLGDLLPLMNY